MGHGPFDNGRKCFHLIVIDACLLAADQADLFATCQVASETKKKAGLHPTFEQ
jgi:hypothetical protein